MTTKTSLAMIFASTIANLSASPQSRMDYFLMTLASQPARHVQVCLRAIAPHYEQRI